MGRLLFLALSLCFLAILISVTLGDLTELFNHPEEDQSHFRDENNYKSNLSFDGDAKAMDDLYTSLIDGDDESKHQYLFDKRDFEKRLVDALDRSKYIDDDAFNKNEKPPLTFDVDYSNSDGNISPNNFNYNLNDDKNSVENYEIDEFGNLNKKSRAKTTDNSQDLINLKFNLKKHRNFYKRNGYNPFRSRKNYRVLGKTNQFDDINYDNVENKVNEGDYDGSDFLLKNIYKNANTKVDEQSEDLENREFKEVDPFKDSRPGAHQNNVLHASFMKDADKNFSANQSPFGNHAGELINYKRNLCTVDDNGIDYDENGKEHFLDLLDEELKIVNDNDLKNIESINKKTKRKRSDKYYKYGGDGDLPVRLPRNQKNATGTGDDNGGNDKFRSRRKQDDIKLLNSALDSNSIGKTPPASNNNKPNSNINNGEKLIKGKDDRIRLAAVSADLSPEMTDGNATQPTTASAVVYLSSQLSTVDDKNKISIRSYHSSPVQSAAVAGCPYGLRSTTQSLASKKKLTKTEELENVRGVYVAPQLKFNTSSNSTEDIRVAHEISDFVANLLYNAGRTGNMRKELGLCKGYDKRLPFHINKPFDDKLLKGLMDCLSNIIKGSIENQKCSEMPAELKTFVDWLLLNGISARDDFRQFMASDTSQRKLFLFPSDGICDNRGSSHSSTPASNLSNSSQFTSSQKPISTTASQKSGKPEKIFRTLKKLYYSPVNIFGDNNNNNVEKPSNKNPYTLFKRYLADQNLYLPPSENDQKFYQNSPLFGNVAQYSGDTDRIDNDWNIKNPSIFEGSDVETEDKYTNGAGLLGPPDRIDLSQYFNDKPGMRKKFKRHDINDVLEFETPTGDDE